MKLFGTDGIRALVNEELMGPEMGVKIGIALVLYCQKRKASLKIIIGRDTRESGVMLEDAIVSGILSAGGNAILAGIIPTPGLAYLVGKEKAGAGIVISASHNSFEYNGLKPFNSDGTKLTNNQELELQKYISESHTRKIGRDFFPGKKTILFDAKEKYIKFLLDKSSNFKSSNLKIIFDCANGATYEIAPRVFGKKAKKFEYLFVNPNGKNINDNCGSQHLKVLIKKVIEKKADLGMAFDGDGDRLIVVDEKGNILNGDQIIYIIAKMLYKKRKLKNNMVVTTIMSNKGFINSLEKLGIKHFATNVGDRQVFFEMKKRGAVLGGEESGHIIISDFQPTGDGIASGLMLISALNCFNKKLSKLAQEIILLPKILVNTSIKIKPKLETIPKIVNIIKKIENKLKKNGRVLVRYSGTENLCRVMVEGKNKKEISSYADQIIKVINNNLN